MKRNFLIVALLSIALGCNDAKEDSTPKIFDFQGTLSHDGQGRSYQVHLPAKYYEVADSLPLVIALHGGGGSADQFKQVTDLNVKADASSFIVVYPEGLVGTGALKLRSWNAGKCCGSNATDNVDDVGFISDLIGFLAAQYRIDQKRVYAIGHSNGAMMSYRLACELSNKIAAIATSAGTFQVKNPCTPSTVIPGIHFHSKQDKNVPYQGGLGTKGISNQWNPSVDSTLNVMGNLGSCATSKKQITTSVAYTFFKWQDCANNLEWHYYLTEDGGHAWPGGNQSTGLDSDPPSTAIEANDLLWDFLKQYSLP